MKEESVLEKLINNLQAPLLFYIPKSVALSFLEEDKSNVDISKLDFFFDTILGVDKNFQLFDLENDIKLLSLLKKEQLLNKNTLALLDLHQHHTKKFNFVFEKYMVHLAYHQYITSWLYDNCHTSLQGVSKKTQQYLLFQKNAFTHHANEINHQFTPHKTPEFNNPQIIKGKEDVLNKKKSKTPIITEQEAEEFLLKTVFGKDR